MSEEAFPEAYYTKEVASTITALFAVLRDSEIDMRDKTTEVYDAVTKIVNMMEELWEEQTL